MLQKKIWIPVLLVLIGFAIGGTFVGRHIASQEPVRVINVVTPEPVERSQPTQAETQPAADGGHWHGDEWHADAHEPVVEAPAPVEDYVDEELAAYEASLSHFTDEERATYDRALQGEIARHHEKYPDCQDHEAVFEDADQNAKWWVGYKKWSEEWDESRAEWKKILTENDDFYDNFYLNMSADERKAFLKNMSDADRASLIEKLKDSEERLEVASQRSDEVNQRKPIEPKPRHTH